MANVYFPKGSGPNRDNSRIPFKLSFYRRLFKLLAQEKDRGGRVMVLGDFNTAHREIDLARPKQNVMNSGFRPEERRELNRCYTYTMPTKITARTNGPLLIEGDLITIADQNGKVFTPPDAAKFALCRCGGSAKKPFCDGTHSKNGFTCPPQS